MTPSYLVVWLEEDLVVFWERHEEDYRRDVFETVDPFPTFRPLPSHVDHPARRNKSQHMPNNSI